MKERENTITQVNFSQSCSIEDSRASSFSGIRERSSKGKTKKNQILQGLILTVIVIFIGYWLSSYNPKMGVFWIIGIAFGYTLQRSRFCFTAAFRDPWLTGSTKLFRALLLAFALGSIGVIAIKYAAVLTGVSKNLNAVDVSPIGLPIVLGGIMFGVGMVIAGGCACGTLMRVGEGFSMQIIVLVFFILGTVWGVHDVGSFWSQFQNKSTAVFLPNVLGWFGAIVFQGLIILLLYIAAVKWQKKKLGSSD